MPRKDPSRTERGPKLNEAVCIGEEVKIGIHLAVQRFRLDSEQEELSFPSSLSTTERAYVHRYCTQLGNLKTWSRGNGQNRYITVRKVEGGKHAKTFPTHFSLNHSSTQVNTLINKYPVTAKERQDLTPPTIQAAHTSDRDKEKSNFGRLTHNVPQVPQKRGLSELHKFRETLPVYQMGSDVIERINANQVVLVAGETGSGKTTQVPQLILDDCCEKQQACRILCTQPRRIAAISIAERVALERGERLGHTVGYQIRLESKISPKTSLIFCTSGVLLRTLMGGDTCLSNVTHVIVDEVHERDRFTDFLLLCLKESLPHHPTLHVILMSATLNMELFSSYFNNCSVICVPGNLYTVEEYFLEDILKWTGYRNKAMDKDILKKQKFKKQEERLSEWCSKQLTIADTAPGSGTEEDSDVTTSDNAELGEEKEDLEPWVIEEMDRLLRDVWLTGNEELFHQILYLISNENVSVDYVQSETGTTPLMIAAGRGFINVVEHLLTLGADANFRTANNWSALDFARKFLRTNIEELLEAHLSSLESGLDKADEDMQLISEEDRELLSMYQHSFDDEKVDTGLITSLIHKIHSSEGDGAILVFLPGYDDIVNLKTAISEDRLFENARYVIYILHSALQHSDQKRIFKNPPNGVRKIILSTNIAETSITINDVVYVVDSGKVKEKTYDALTSLTALKSNWISKASALQRKGRAGRCQPGKCYHLFSRSRYMHLQDYQTPEILRLPLQELCLHTKLLAPEMESIVDFLSKCPQAPPTLVIRNAVLALKQIDALDPFEDMTELGQHLADLPIEPRLGKIVLYSVVLKCLDPVLTIVCTLAFKEPFIIPALPSERRSVMGKRRRFAEETYSDHMVFLRAFQAWQKARAEGWERAFCDKNFISSSTMEMLLGMRMQLLAQLRASGFLRARGAGDIRDLNTNSDNWALVKACLLAGTYPNIIQRDEDNALCTITERNVRFHSSSVLQPVTSVTSMHPVKSLKKVIKSLPSKWIIYEEMSRFQRVSLAKYCTLVSPAAVFLFGGHSKVTTDAITQLPFPRADSDSDEEMNKKSNQESTRASEMFVKLDDWIGFDFESHGDAKAAVLFRMKWHSLFLNRMRHPTRAWTQVEEAVLQAVCAVLTNAEKAIGLENPVGVGQRPRAIEPLMGAGFEDYYGRPGSGGSGGNGGGYQQQHHHQQQQHHHQQQQHHQPQYQPQQHMYKNSGVGRGYNNQQQRNYQGYNRSVQPSGGAKSESNTSTPYDSPQSESPVLPTSGGPASPHATASAGRHKDGRYFLMRCNSQKVVDVSESKGIWATSVSNEAKLNRAFGSGKPVYLIFSVPGNANFQGYARMTSPISKNRSPDFPGSGLSGTFSLEWMKRATLPFSNTNFLNNPWNEGRRVHAGRDGQEIEPKTGMELLRLWDTLPLIRPPSAGKRKPSSQQNQRSQQKQQQGRKDKPSGARSESSCASEDHSDNGRDRSEVSQSSPSPALSTNTTHSSNSSASSPAHCHDGAPLTQPGSAQAQAGLQSQSSTGCYPGSYQQHGGYVQPSVSPPGISSLLATQPGGINSPPGPNSGLSPVMILQRSAVGSGQQPQLPPQYYPGV